MLGGLISADRCVWFCVFDCLEIRRLCCADLGCHVAYGCFKMFIGLLVVGLLLGFYVLWVAHCFVGVFAGLCAIVVGTLWGYGRLVNWFV